MAPISSNTEQPKWSAANAKDRIAIVTTDAALDARIRAALRDEGYEFVTVPDFATHHNELIDTILCIVDARSKGSKDSWTISRHIRNSEFGWGYTLLGVVKPKPDSERTPFDHSPWDMALEEPFSAVELDRWVSRLVQIAREPDEGTYRI